MLIKYQSINQSIKYGFVRIESRVFSLSQDSFGDLHSGFCFAIALVMVW